MLGRRCRLFAGLSGALLIAALACGSLTDSRAETAQEFVQKYAEAHRTNNVGAIVAMTELAPGQSEEAFRAELEADLERGGFGAVAWSNTRYLSESDRGGHLAVEVEVQYARSTIVLVKRDGLLKIVTDPSRYEEGR